MRPKRKGEQTCRCEAYRFPHRKYGGDCLDVQAELSREEERNLFHSMSYRQRQEYGRFLRSEYN